MFFVAQQLHTEFDENLYFLCNIKAMDRHNINLHPQTPRASSYGEPQSKVVLGRSGPISFHRLNRQESAEILRASSAGVFRGNLLGKDSLRLWREVCIRGASGGA